ncbi:hypothetical protein [Nonomuraea wenchangensis]|uniref:Uncharacterized protein n=1 Tax=Nonomuraea wenchangensis TaxID=568860 RepID=A0A1I0F0G7_9ACTN|nr:hypothetical protein [Nonomuraea wenchangensis]SET51465.1 hypothetical protein SAMN05421811_103279 [Nonomuraea wenchangensis]
MISFAARLYVYGLAWVAEKTARACARVDALLPVDLHDVEEGDGE